MTTAITTSSRLYPDSLAPPTSARGVSNPTTTKVTMPAKRTQTTAVPVSRLDVWITPGPYAEVLVTQICNLCRRTFYGTVCFTNHVSKTQSGKIADHQQPSVCTCHRKCRNCCKLLVGHKQQQEHWCGYVTCPPCHHCIEALLHWCFIQLAKTPKEEQAECRVKQRPGCCLRGAAAGLATVHSNEDNVPSTSLLPSPPVYGVDLNEEKPPLHVFFDVEAM